MNPRQIELWFNLMNLVNTNESFYFVDKKLDDVWYRCFSYRLANYSDFLNPDALECRGHLFEIAKSQYENDLSVIPIRLACWPIQKFFNLNENPMTMNLDLDNINTIASKADGSLISTFLHNNELRLKSKTSLESEQALDAMEWLNLEQNIKFKEELYILTKLNFTINLEWCSRKNQIVLGYDTPKLIILNVRDNENGKYVHKYLRYIKENGHELLLCSYQEICNNWVIYEQPEDPKNFILNVVNMKNIEGFVVKLTNGLMFKVKTDWYCDRHKAKDSINNQRQLFEAVINEVTDDLRQLFVNDSYALMKITEMEEHVKNIFTKTIHIVENFYNTNKHLNRKDYAILGQQSLEPKEFNLVMMKYIGKEVDIKEWMKKNFDSFELK